MILEAEAPISVRAGIACVHCRALNANRIRARVPAHVYREQGVVTVDGATPQCDGPGSSVKFTPFRCIDPACATLWLRGEEDGVFAGWLLGS